MGVGEWGIDKEWERKKWASRVRTVPQGCGSWLLKDANCPNHSWAGAVVIFEFFYFSFSLIFYMSTNCPSTNMLCRFDKMRLLPIFYLSVVYLYPYLDLAPTPYWISTYSRFCPFIYVKSSFKFCYRGVPDLCWFLILSFFTSQI